MALLGAVLAWLFFAPSLLQAVGDFLVITDPPAPADVVIAVSGDGTGERARAAADLLRRGYVRWVIISGSRRGFAPGGATAAMVRQALRAGVPRARLLVEDASTSTLDNARHTARLMRAHGLRRAIVVTSPYHTRRAAWTFRSVFRPQGLQVRVLAAGDSFFQVKGWWTRPQERALVVREYAKLLAFLVGIR